MLIGGGKALEEELAQSVANEILAKPADTSAADEELQKQRDFALNYAE